ncbi:MAG TPA: YceD family protein [Burkholderiales bacterium]|nr:YceD family protein [Burkholderiales bacterium]
MSHQPVIDGFEFATAGATQEGKLPLSSFPRLQDVLVSDTGDVAYALRGVRDERGRASLLLSVHATLQLRCQRCLGPLAHEVQAEQVLVLAASQAEIDADPASVDAPDRVLAGKEMAVRDLVEDELILALPYAPRHEGCEARPEGTDLGSVANSPFAGLRGMMQRKH